MMGEIYAKASNVIAYIGEALAGCDVAVYTINRISEKYQLHFDDEADGEILTLKGVPLVSGGIKWAYMWKFLETPWYVSCVRDTEPTT